MSIGVWELLLILAIVFVIFGAGKLPQVMSELGKGVKSLKDGMKNEAKKDQKKDDKNQADEDQKNSEKK